MCSLLESKGKTVNAALLKPGGLRVVLTTSYSGMGCPEMASVFLEQALHAKGYKVKFTFHAATDYSSTCQDLLTP